MPHQFVKHVNCVGQNCEFVVLCLKPACYLPRVIPLVIPRLVEYDREGLDRFRAELRHHCHYCTRIDASTQEGPQRYVAYHSQSDRFLQPLNDLLAGLPLINLELWQVVHAPVTVRFDPALTEREVMSGRQLLDALESALCARHVAEGQVMVDCRRIGFGPDARMCEQSLDLRCEHKPAFVESIVKRFFAKTIARDEQKPFAFIPDGEREHPPQKLQALDPHLLVQMNNYLSVGARFESVPPTQQPFAMFFKIVNLSIEDDSHAPVFVSHRLSAFWPEINNREPPMPQTYAGPDVRSLVVGTAMSQSVAHVRDQTHIHWFPPVSVNYTADSTHDRITNESDLV